MENGAIRQAINRFTVALCIHCESKKQAIIILPITLPMLTDYRQHCAQCKAPVYKLLIPRLHDTTGCQDGCRTALTTGCMQIFNRFDNRFDNRLYCVNGALEGDFEVFCPCGGDTLHRWGEI